MVINHPLFCVELISISYAPESLFSSFLLSELTAPPATSGIAVFETLEKDELGANASIPTKINPNSSIKITIERVPAIAKSAMFTPYSVSFSINITFLS